MLKTKVTEWKWGEQLQVMPIRDKKWYITNVCPGRVRWKNRWRNLRYVNAGWKVAGSICCCEEYKCHKKW